MSNCPSCGKDAVRVSPQSVPKAGPLQLDGATIHRHDGAAYYHL
ncbi:hypothetical protein [Haloarcula sp. S1AR25-4]|nr:hypothetical protein [Halomicroarcula sp. S1AR25-4]